MPAISVTTINWRRGLVALMLAAGLTAQPAAADVERRLDRIERLLDGSTLMDMNRLQERLRQEVQALRGEVEVMQRTITDLERQQRNLYEDLDSRLQALERGTETVAPAPTVPDTPALDAELARETPPATPDGETDIADADMDTRADGDAEADYQKAFELLREGRYAQAGDAFRVVLERHPGTLYAENALYWLGESYYVVREFDTAMEHFEAVIADEDNNKRPDALLKKGYIHYERGQWQQARTALEEARDRYPGTTVATLAENRLQRMREEGR
ncbi:MAG: tol-pal system protein YbgF [Ectothiorhodospiraceae bacterium]|nr:tol-pal system protein YbgF [Ectothiorhodospiraceae bacterium]